MKKSLKLAILVAILATQAQIQASQAPGKPKFPEFGDKQFAACYKAGYRLGVYDFKAGKSMKYYSRMGNINNGLPTCFINGWDAAVQHMDYEQYHKPSVSNNSPEITTKK